jgi:predicted  nucleic acid-binding Zn-ribbon protein
MEEVKAYCMKCKAERVVKDAQIVTTKNGRTAAQGTCPVCGTKMFKFLPKQKPAPAEAVPSTPAPVAPADLVPSTPPPAAPADPAPDTPTLQV